MVVRGSLSEFPLLDSPCWAIHRIAQRPLAKSNSLWVPRDSTLPPVLAAFDCGTVEAVEEQQPNTRASTKFRAARPCF